MMTFGFIGTGNMGGAVAKAVAKAAKKEQILLSNRTPEKAQVLAKELGCEVRDNLFLAQNCDFLFLGVKPQMMGQLLADLAPVLAKREAPAVLVSMAAGLTMKTVQKMAGGNYPVIRIMPNTPVSVGQGVVLYDATENVSDRMLETFTASMKNAGLVDRLPESLIDAGSAVAGCGPAFAAMFMQALADGGVKCGLPRQKALLYAAQMLQGSAKLLQESGQHPGQMKDAVCSPGGSTIAGVKALEQGAFPGTVMDAVEKAYLRTKELGKA